MTDRTYDLIATWCSLAAAISGAINLHKPTTAGVLVNSAAIVTWGWATNKGKRAPR